MGHSETDLMLVRDLLAREFRTINHYLAMLDQARHPALRKLLESIINEEKEHVAEALAVLGQRPPVSASQTAAPHSTAPQAAPGTGTHLVEYQPFNRRISVPGNQTLLAAATAAQLPIRHDCGGRGICGTCRVQVLAGGNNLTPQTEPEARLLGALTQQGWRLACQTRTRGPVSVRVPEKQRQNKE